ncbi:arsenate reductase ArsC [Paenibacillus validus]|uniref:arsenate reductase ArsC n=1 Tax=Paenibacillus validus TaxID=44253 RepID=UPI003D2DD66D
MQNELRLYFLCGQNRCRSQMAEAFARHCATDKVFIDSAGLDPSPLHPLTIEAMNEVGIDISQQQSKKINMKIFLASDVIVKLCEDIQERCPIVPFRIRNEQWNIRGPLSGSSPTLDDVRKAREEIKQKVTILLQSYNAYAPDRVNGK